MRTDGRTDGQNDGRTDITKLIVAFRNFPNVPNNGQGFFFFRLHLRLFRNNEFL